MIDWRQAMQQLGRSLMLPIAVLPVAGLLLRFGQPDLLDLAFVAAAGDAIFAHLGLLFAIGVAVGLARENHGAAGLAGVVGFLVATQGIQSILGSTPAEVGKLGVPLGIISGVIAGALYNRYSDIRLPDYLAFFSGRRFVPIASGCVALLVAAVFGLAWPKLVAGIDLMSRTVIDSGGIGLFLFGVLNRILIVTGLHHILNNVAWFLVGDFGGATGDLKRFFAGDPNAGAFMSGFFPVMMFGLPAACFAMYREARPERRKAVAGMLSSMALTSFLTGVTEPIEFSFMFLAPVLYVLHAILTGLSMVLMDALDIRLGFSFSAGALDYVLNFDKARNAWLLWPVGLAYALLYYFAFRFAIRRWQLATPGREAEGSHPAASETAQQSGAPDAGWINALGGRDNLLEVSACTTRLRLQLADPTNIDRELLRRLGSRGELRVGHQGLQVVLGPIADQTASAIRAALHALPVGPPETATVAPSKPEMVPLTEPDPLPDMAALLQSLGGAGNLVQITAQGGRVRIELADPARIDLARVDALLARGMARIDAHRWHLLHGDAVALAEALRRGV